MITELIASFKPVTVKGREMVLITTKSNAEVWVPASQFDATQETVSYKPRKAGEEYVKKDNTKAKLLKDRNDFVGLKRSSTLDVMDYLISKGITPTFALSK